ncbi:MAG: prephenate dehydrogenase [Chloroflexi bacterium]|nr:prephenate dehydrogenase [Chloroflexota bacterium]
MISPVTDTPLAPLHIVIVGLGLMGASLAYDLKGHCRKVTGVVRRPQAAEQALAAGCVDDASLHLTAAVATADLVIMATPVRTILRQIPRVGQAMQPGAILLDMGSTKQAICGAMHVLPEHVQVIGGHPMCGKEQAGLAAAEAGLYRDCTFVLCPLPRTSASTLELVHVLLATIGARPLVLESARHDKLVAAISHLPYLAACALVAHTRNVAATDPIVWDVAASGFRDSSRVAASDVNMLLDILLTNRLAVLSALADFQEHLGQWQQWLARGEEEKLRTELEIIADARRQWHERR